MDHPLSSFAQKVRIALREKALPFRAALPDGFGAAPADGTFARANPRAEVPVLIDRDAPDGPLELFESSVILDYLDDRWPDTALRPADPGGRAKARLIETLCDTQYEAVNWGWGEVLWFRRAEGELADRLRGKAVAHIAVLQDWLAIRLGGADWFGGDRFGRADLAAAPMVNRSAFYGIGPAADTPLGRWLERVRSRPSVRDTFAEFETAAARMAEAPSLYTTGGRRREYRDHRLDWMIRAGGIEVVRAGLATGTIRFSWPGPVPE